MGEARGRSGELSAWRVCGGGDIVDQTKVCVTAGIAVDIATLFTKSARCLAGVEHHDLTVSVVSNV